MYGEISCVEKQSIWGDIEKHEQIMNDFISKLQAIQKFKWTHVITFQRLTNSKFNVHSLKLYNSNLFYKFAINIISF